MFYWRLMVPNITNFLIRLVYQTHPTFNKTLAGLIFKVTDDAYEQGHVCLLSATSLLAAFSPCGPDGATHMFLQLSPLSSLTHLTSSSLQTPSPEYFFILRFSPNRSRAMLHFRSRLQEQAGYKFWKIRKFWSTFGASTSGVHTYITSVYNGNWGDVSRRVFFSSSLNQTGQPR